MSSEIVGDGPAPSTTLRIAFLIDSLGAGGAERSLAELLPELRDLGFEVHLICLRHETFGAEPQLLAAGVPVTFLRATSWLGRIMETRRLLRRWAPHILHTTLLTSDILGRAAAARLPVRVLTSLVNTTYDKAHRSNPDVSPVKLRIVQLVDACTARFGTDHFHAISEPVAREATRSLSIPSGRLTVIERGRDEQRLGVRSDRRRADSRRRLGLDLDTTVFVCVGRQEYQKGHLVLLRAMDALLARHPLAVLLLVGRPGHASGPLREFLATHADTAAAVRVLGHREDIGEMLSASDVFVFPSLYEGLGGAVLEALALELPVVASALPALEHVLDEGHNALLVPPGDPDALAGAMARLMSDGEMRRSFGKHSRRIFDERFTLERSVHRMASLYRSLAAQG